MKGAVARPPNLSVNRTLNILALTCFAASLSIRSLDPVLPQISGDLSVDLHTAALLSSAFAFPYALVQPVLGAVGDMFGKPRLLVICLLILIASAAAGALAPNFPMLISSRVVSGLAAGGVFPIALALTGDLVRVNERQIALGRLLGASLTGILVGSVMAGFIADWIGWRGVLALIAGLTLVSAGLAAYGFRATKLSHQEPLSLRSLKSNYLAILRNPNARICFPAVFVEGVCIFGIFPFVASLLIAQGEPRLSIAGLVISGFAVGGVIYSFSVRKLLGRFGERGLIVLGTSSLAVMLVGVAFAPPWPVQLLCMTIVGIGFYCLHGCLQTYATELAPGARASATALHACFFFSGQAVGPIAYGAGFQQLGTQPTFFIAAATMALLGLFCARFLRAHD